jgi:hypothetical protein
VKHLRIDLDRLSSYAFPVLQTNIREVALESNTTSYIIRWGWMDKTLIDPFIPDFSNKKTSSTVKP